MSESSPNRRDDEHTPDADPGVSPGEAAGSDTGGRPAGHGSGRGQPTGSSPDGDPQAPGDRYASVAIAPGVAAVYDRERTGAWIQSDHTVSRPHR